MAHITGKVDMDNALRELKALQREDPPSNEILNKSSDLMKNVLAYKDPQGYDYELYHWDIRELEYFVLRHFADTRTFQKALASDRFVDPRDQALKAECYKRFKEENPERQARLINREPVEVKMTESLVQLDPSESHPEELSTEICQEFGYELLNIKPNPDEAPYFDVTIKSQMGEPYTLNVKVRGFKPRKGVIEVTSYRNRNRMFKNFNLDNVISARLAE